MHKEKFYNEKWHKWNDMILFSPAPRLRRRMIIKMLKGIIQDGHSLHDIGCGNGLLLSEISKCYKNLIVSGSDISEEVIMSNRRANKLIDYFVLDIEDKEIRFADQYEIIICSEVLEHVDDLNSALLNIYKLLKPSGHAIITVPRGRIFPIDKKVGHISHFNDSSLFADFFFIKKEVKWGFPFFNLYKWCINLKPDQMSKAFCDSKYGMLEKSFSNLIYFLFLFNLPLWGFQLVTVLQKK